MTDDRPPIDPLGVKLVRPETEQWLREQEEGEKRGRRDALVRAATIHGFRLARSNPRGLRLTRGQRGHITHAASDG